MSPALSQLRNGAAIFLVFLRLGLTSFGGPAAHLGYFREAFVVRRQWLSERSYADLVALCQFLPGPASSQVGMALGLSRGGYLGALAAWAGFTLPSALLLTLLALGIAHSQGLPDSALHGLQVVALAVIAQAVYAMARLHCRSPAALALMLAACGLTLWLTWPGAQVAVLLVAGLLGLLLFRPATASAADPLPVPVSRRAGVAWLLLFVALLLGLPLLHGAFPGTGLAVLDAFYRSGALVFGGGHVVLPLLHSEVVVNGWVGEPVFFAGYAAAQAVPGPLFSFAAFLGASLNTGLAPWSGAALALLAIFAPSFLLVAGALPFWSRLSALPALRAALTAVNAAVVGLLLAALIAPLAGGAISGSRDLLLGLAALLALTWPRLPPWLVVVAGALAGLWGG
ncbi:chromate efflux transporter [uncultured Pseudomonas sp.]|uniref:chromate efflux transporter n=1 Tax=uncultured Pseudomonas sp. TaxID=114707 RepID=UPI0025CEBF7E|nr:chromate efflux transporter [uncultured Pseudomonas sp.]